MKTLLPIVLSLAYLTLQAGCTSPCRELSETICRCEPTESAVQNCLQSLNTTGAQLSITAAEEEVCSDILESESCTCESLANGDSASCGKGNNPVVESP